MIKTNRFIVLDSFRGLCALSLVLFHLHVPNSLTELVFFKNAHLLVEFFFILSGFVLFHTYKSSLLNYLDFKLFIIKRVCRLYPLHLFTLLIFIFFECCKWFAEMKGFSFNGHAFSGSNAPKEILPNLFLLQSWLTQADPLSFNGPSWSISSELYIYILFALIIILNRTLSTYIFSGIAGFALMNLLTEHYLFKETAIRVLLCFFLGVLIYKIYSTFKNSYFSKYVLTIFELIALIGAFFILNLNINYQRVIASFWFCIVILTFALEGGWISSLLKQKFFKYLGELSYSIYMLHLTVIFLLVSIALIISRLTHFNFAPMLKEAQTGELIRYVTTGSWLGNNLLVMLVLFIILALSRLSRRYIELPGLNFGEKFLFKEKLTPQFHIN